MACTAMAFNSYGLALLRAYTVAGSSYALCHGAGMRAAEHLVLLDELLREQGVGGSTSVYGQAGQLEYASVGGSLVCMA